MATTTNYSWETPDDTDLVKDGAAAIRTLGSSIDTTTKALNPSTTLGDIEYRSSTANTNTRLGIGTTGQILTVSGGVPAWASPAGGKLLQVVSATYSTSTTIASTTFTDTGLSLAITPSATTSKILVMVTQPIYLYRGTTTTAGANVRIMRDATAVITQGGTNNNGSGRVGMSGSATTDADLQSIVTLIYLDSPSSTSSLTYKTQSRLDTTANGASSTFQLNSATSTITLFEIGA